MVRIVRPDEDSDDELAKHHRLEGKLADQGMMAFWPLRMSSGPLRDSLSSVRCFILLSVCIVSVTQNGMTLVVGQMAPDLDSYYKLTSAGSGALYTWMTFGACAFSFVPGLLYGHFGPTTAMAIGTAAGVLPVAAQLAWGPALPGPGSMLDGLSVCYFFFGVSSSFFTVIGSCAPLAVFDERHVGKISAAVQVSLSLGLSFQAMIYAYMKESYGGEFMQSYLTYTLAFLSACGTLMCMALATCEDLLTPKPQAQSAARGQPHEEKAEPLVRVIWKLVFSVEFAHIFLLFMAGIGFAFSFFTVQARFAVDAGVDPSSLSVASGIIQCVGRAATSVPLDYTRHLRFGGVHTYTLLALSFFVSGLACLLLPAEPGAPQVFVANALVSLGWGGLMGVTPPAVRLQFGPDNMVLVYGLLYMGVAVSVPAWGLLESAAYPGCRGVACYRQFCLAGAMGLASVLVLTAVLAARASRRWQPPIPLAATLLEKDLCTTSKPGTT